MEEQEPQEQQPQKNPLLKYFLHGFLFSLLTLVLGFVGIFFLLALTMVGLFIGFIIGILLILLSVGVLNAILTNWLWDVQIKMGIISLLGHGFVLLLALLLVHIPAIIVAFASASHPLSWVVSIVSFVAYAFVDGYVAKNVAGMWEQEYDSGYDYEAGYKDSSGQL